MTHLPC